AGLELDRLAQRLLGLLPLLAGAVNPRPRAPAARRRQLGDARGERLGLLDAAADDSRRLDVEREQRLERRHIVGLELDGALERLADLAGERQCAELGQPAHALGAAAVGATGPDERIGVVRIRLDGFLERLD